MLYTFLILIITVKCEANRTNSSSSDPHVPALYVAFILPMKVEYYHSKKDNKIDSNSYLVLSFIVFGYLYRGVHFDL